MQSLWEKTAQLPSFDSLSKDRSTDVAIVGGGMAGLLTAYLLKECGVDALVLEADRIAGGQTKGTTAKVTSQHGLIYQKLIHTLGERTAAGYAAANEHAIFLFEKIIKEKKIDCQWERRPAYLYSVLESEPLEKEVKAAQSIGLPAGFTTETELPFPVKGAVRFSDQAQFHPLLFLKGILPGLSICEQTKVIEVKENRIKTEKGIVTAKKIVFASHFPFVNVPGYYFARMHQERSYVLALQNAPLYSGMYLGIDEKEGWSFRSSQGRLLLGGEGHRTGENRVGGSYEKLREKAKELFPDSVEELHWSAQDCMPLDQMPYIGRFSDAEPDWYAATGFQKWGMTSSMVSAKLISDLIVNGESEYEAVFTPSRFTPVASTASFINEGVHTVKDLSRRIFAPPRAALEKLPVGHGGVIEADGEKVGAYREESGKIFFVSVKCPHLGCQLEWNPDEKSWDCPCHGSRFDYRGKLLDDPAQQDLPNREEGI